MVGTGIGTGTGNLVFLPYLKENVSVVKKPIIKRKINKYIDNCSLKCNHLY